MSSATRPFAVLKDAGYVRMRRISAWLFLCAFCTGAVQAESCTSGRLADFVANGYGERIEFDVLRNGKPIGEHVTQFTHSEAGLVVESSMKLTVRILAIPVYRFAYRSRDVWCNGRLSALDASVDDNGTLSRVRAVREDGQLRIERDGVKQQVAADLMPTNHWNPDVLGQDRVLNTLTGLVNEVRIAPCSQPSDLIAAAAPEARCHAYTGDLEAKAWYDDFGRWVGLEFSGDDGSEIVYVCRRCGGAGA